MKRGYVVGEYILVSFFFLILFVLIVNTFTDFTLNEYEKVNEFEECKNSKKIFPHQREGKRNVKVYFIDGSERLIPQFWLIILHPPTDP